MSVAPGWETPRGTFSIVMKFPKQDMQGGVGADHYFQPDVPWIMYFTYYGHALHGSYWSPSFGWATSHGCYGIPVEYARWIYDRVSIGTTFISR